MERESGPFTDGELIMDRIHVTVSRRLNCYNRLEIKKIKKLGEEKMDGIFYGVGVGPGDPELMTVKAVKTIETCDILALPVSSGELTEPVFDESGTDSKYECYLEKCVAYQIVLGSGADVSEKAKLYLPMPMMKEKEVLKRLHDKGAEVSEEYLKKGRNIVFITLGDPTVYSTCMYIYKRIYQKGYQTEMIPGVPSFCAAAARLDIGLVENKEELHVIPASYEIESGLELPGTKVLMKVGKKIPYVKQVVKEKNMEIKMVENCGMESERIYSDVEEIPDETSYYSLFIIKESKAGGK